MTPASLLSRCVSFLALAALLSGTVVPLADAQAAPEQTREKPRDLMHFNLDKRKLALQGYDPVAYFTVGGGKPRKGLETITVTHEGVTYRFANEDDRKLFLATPEKFEPQYGGWCAYAMANGEKVEIDPASFLVTDGKLYVFFKAWYADTRAKWKKDEKSLTARADRAWQALTVPRPESPRAR